MVVVVNEKEEEVMVEVKISHLLHQKQKFTIANCSLAVVKGGKMRLIDTRNVNHPPKDRSINGADPAQRFWIVIDSFLLIIKFILIYISPIGILLAFALHMDMDKKPYTSKP